VFNPVSRYESVTYSSRALIGSLGAPTRGARPDFGSLLPMADCDWPDSGATGQISRFQAPGTASAIGTIGCTDAGRFSQEGRDDSPRFRLAFGPSRQAFFDRGCLGATLKAYRVVDGGAGFVSALEKRF